jgi:signal transduction histidine kinase
MKRLVGDLTDVTSLEAGQLAVATSPNDGRELVQETLESFRPLAAEKGIMLEGQVGDVPLLLMCDRGRILQVLANLVGNALKFTPVGGRVYAGATRLGDDVCFSVTDSGPGIPENLLESVFERFWQAAKDDRRGLGLGLYIAKSLVEAHGGRIWVESRLGEGSTFFLRLPVVSPANQTDPHQVS